MKHLEISLGTVMINIDINGIWEKYTLNEKIFLLEKSLKNISNNTVTFHSLIWKRLTPVVLFYLFNISQNLKKIIAR